MNNSQTLLPSQPPMESTSLAKVAALPAPPTQPPKMLDIPMFQTTDHPTENTEGEITSISEKLKSLLPTVVDGTEPPHPLPPIIGFDDLMKTHPTKPEPLIKGVIGRGDKMIVSAPSKAGKTWLLLGLAHAGQNGGQWLGHQCAKMNVLYVNFELNPNWLAQRWIILESKKPTDGADDVCYPSVLNLRGHEVDWLTLENLILEHSEATDTKFDLIILDPIYKMLGEADENSNGNIATLLNSLERMGSHTQAAIVFAHHHSKGNKSSVDVIERMAGAGVWGRDPDAIVDLIPHEDEDCYVVEAVTRNYVKPPKLVVRCNFPDFIPVGGANPNALRKPGGSTKKLSESDVVAMCQDHPQGVSNAQLVRELAKAHQVSEETGRKRIKEALDQGLIEKDGKKIMIARSSLAHPPQVHSPTPCDNEIGKP